jgi:chitinase
MGNSSSKHRLPGQPASHELINAGCWPFWVLSDGNKPSDIDISNLTAVKFCFAGVKPNGTLYFEDSDLVEHKEVDGVQGCLRAWTKRRSEKPDLKIILAIGGGKASSTKEMQNAAKWFFKADTFVASVRMMVAKYDLDGVTLD